MGLLGSFRKKNKSGIEGTNQSNKNEVLDDFTKDIM